MPPIVTRHTPPIQAPAAPALQSIAPRSKRRSLLLPGGSQTRGTAHLRGAFRARRRIVWPITHEDLKHTARIRAFLSAAGHAIAAARRSFEGTG
jgi:hypothetical protein